MDIHCDNQKANLEYMGKYFVLAVVTSLLFIVNGCYLNDFEDIEEVRVESFSPSFGFPVVNSSVSLKDLLESADPGSVIVVRNDSIILQVSENFQFELDLNTFNVPDREFGLLIPISESSSETYLDDYATIGSDSEIKRIDLSGGELWIEFERSGIDDVGAELMFTSLRTTEQPGGLVAVSDWSDDPYVSRHVYDLSGSVLDMFVIDGTDTVYNSISYGVSVSSAPGVSGDVAVRFGFSSVEFERMTGLIYHDIELPAQEINLGALSSVIEGEIFLKNPALQFDIGTSFGTPSSVLIDEIRFENYDNEIRYLENTGTDLEDALLLGESNYLPFGTEELPYASRLFRLDAENSNIEQVLPFSPNKISFSGNFNIGDTDQTYVDPHEFYVSDTSSFNIDMDVEIPLSGSIENLRFSEVISGLTWPEFDSIDLVDDYKVALLLKTVNGLPLTFALQASFLDEHDNVLASLFDTDEDVENIIESPDIDGNGNPVAGTEREKLTVVELSRDKYDAIASSDKTEFVLRVDTGTESQREVNILASQTVTIQISVALDITVNPDTTGN
ncbi:MAG: hypothetical protein EA408_07845 [Marinilabiliales bacterium]|nr:MAG: hypothetical protein EA408_07845 [Marinilabiliales bacterium]